MKVCTVIYDAPSCKERLSAIHDRATHAAHIDEMMDAVERIAAANRDHMEGLLWGLHQRNPSSLSVVCDDELAIALRWKLPHHMLVEIDDPLFIPPSPSSTGLKPS